MTQHAIYCCVLPVGDDACMKVVAVGYLSVCVLYEIANIATLLALVDLW